MPLQFVFGPSGSGKSHHLYQYIIKESMRYPKQNFIVLVPEQFTMQTQKDLVTAHPRKGIMNIDVLSFGRLAYRVFEESGGGGLPVLDDEGKNLILRKIAVNYESQLKVLKGNMKKLGYISEVKSVISEFTQYDIKEDELIKVMEGVGKDSRFYYKLQDLKVLYQGFTDFLQEKYITKEELLDVLSGMVAQSELLKNSTIVLDGFTGFTPVQNRLLKELMKHCIDVKVTVTIEEHEDPFSYTHPYQLFAISKQTASSLAKIAKEANVVVLESVRLFHKPIYRFRANDVFAFLEQNIFRYGKEEFKEVQDVLNIRVARNPKAECMAAAGRIRQLLRTQGYRCRDIGVVVSNMDIYGDYLERAFALYEIPVFMDHKRSILLNSFVEYIRSVLTMVEQGFTYESVFRFLKTDLSSFSADEVDELENYVIGVGIKGYKKWQAAWKYQLRGTDEGSLLRLNHMRVAFVEQVEALVFFLKQRNKTVRDITMAIYEFMVKEEIQEKLAHREAQFQQLGELTLAKEYAQVYRITLELFDKFVALLGDEPVGLLEYCKLLDAGLEEAKVGVIPPSVDQVIIGDVERTRFKDIKVLLLLGANDSHLPGALGSGGILSERDRERFAKEQLTLSPGGKEKTYTQKFYLYMNLTKPSDLLEVYYSRVSQDGKSIRPSYLIQELKRLYPLIEIADEEGRNINEIELTEKTALHYLTSGLQDIFIRKDSQFQELYSWYKSHERWARKLQLLLEARFLSCPKDSITMELAQMLYGEDFQHSITRMERYAACPYAQFLIYGLKLSERVEFDFKALDLGNICHVALEKYARKVECEHADWTLVEKDLQRTWVAESVDEAVEGYGNAVLYSSSRNAYMIYRMKQMLQTTVWALTKQIAAGDFRPDAYELRFANGKIDRVDLCQDKDKVYVKVVDYKTGAKAFDVVSLYQGLQLQLMVYMNAAVERECKRYPDKEVIPAGVFYYRVKNPIVDKGEANREHALLSELKVDGLINLQDGVIKHLERNMQGESLVLPVKSNKNGSLAKGSKVLEEEDFHAVMKYAVHKVEETHCDIVDGRVPVHPYRKGQETGCDYCAYKNVCRFDVKIPGYRYREIGKMSKEEAIIAMRGDAKR